MADTTDKTELQWKPVSGRNPATGDAIERPQLTNLKTCYATQVVKRALERGYIRGQLEDMKGVANGLYEAEAKLLEEGNAVNTGWLRMEPMLTGKLDETNTITDANDLKLSITPLEALKLSKSNFTFKNTGDTSAKPTISSICSVGGKKGEILDDAVIIASGSNLLASYTLGDVHTIDYLVGGETKSVEITAIEGSDAQLRFAFPSALKAADKDSELVFNFVLHTMEGGAVTNITKKATWLGSDDPVVTGESMDGTDNVARFGSAYTEDVTGVRLEGGAKVTAILDGASGNNKVDSTELTVVDSTHLQVKFGTNSSDHPDGDWADKTTTWNFYDANGELVSTYAGVIWKTA